MGNLLTRQFVTELADRGRSKDTGDASLISFKFSVSQCRRDVYSGFSKRFPAYSNKNLLIGD